MRWAAGLSGNHGQKRLVQLALGVVETGWHFLPVSCYRRLVWIALQTAAESLEAVTRRIETIDRHSASYAVSGWADFDRNLVHRHDVASAQNLFP